MGLISTISPITPVQLGWIAGFFEGEAYFRTQVLQGESIRITQKQQEPLERLHKILGGNLRKRKTGYYEWDVASARAAAIMMTVYSLMSPRRKEQIRTALLSWIKRPLPKRKDRGRGSY
jgi:hypothetical protein